MSDLNDIVAEILESCVEHIESAAAASDDGDPVAHEYHLDVVHSRLLGVVSMLRADPRGSVRASQE